MFNMANSRHSYNNSNQQTPQCEYEQSPPNLPHLVRQQIEEGWRNIADKRLFTVSIPESYEHRDSLGPKPFPKLDNFSNENPDLPSNSRQNPENRQSNNSSYIPPEVLPNRGLGLNQRNRPRSLSTASNAQATSSSPTTYKANVPRPVSAPPINYKQNNQTKDYRVTRGRNLQISKTDIQSIPDDQDLYSSGAGELEEGRRSGSNQTISMARSNSFLASPSSSGAFESPKALLKALDEHEKKKRDSAARGSSSQEVTEASTYLMNAGIHLLETGRRTLIENQSSTEQSENLKQAAEKLNTLVQGQLKFLQEENEILRRENLLLKDHLVNSTIENNTAGGYSIPPLITMKTPQGEIIHSQKKNSRLSSNTFQPIPYTNSPDYSKYQSHSGENQENVGIEPQLNQFPENTNIDVNDILGRMKALEDTIFRLMKSSSEQTTKVQDRLYQQEMRYEETLTKFEEVIASLTVMFTAFQHQVAVQQSSRETINPAIAAAQLTDAIENLETIAKSAKRVQFRGILKQD